MSEIDIKNIRLSLITADDKEIEIAKKVIKVLSDEKLSFLQVYEILDLAKKIIFTEATI